MKKFFKIVGVLLIASILLCNTIHATTPTVVLDAGHGGADSGAVSQENSYLEKVWNLQTTKSCKETLEKYGINVIMTREDDIFLSLAERKQIANNADISVSIHYNASQSRNGSYGLVIGGKVDGSTDLAVSIKDELLKIRDNVQVWETGRYAMTNLKVPCVIVESAFIDSKDSKYADTLEEREKIGRHIAYGILNYLNIDINKNIVEPTQNKQNETQNKNNNLDNVKKEIKNNNDNKISMADKIKNLILGKKANNDKIEYIRNLLLK